MSVRVCHMQRGDRGLSLRGLRLVGASSDARWASDPAENGQTFAKGASWVRSSMQSARSTDALEYICLDASGMASAWVTSPSTDPNVVAMLARQGPAGDLQSSTGAASPGAGPIDFFAGTPMDSSIEAFAPAVERDGAISARTGVIVATDVPARLLLDALDKEGVRVGAVGTLWHAMALAWDAPLPSASEAVVATNQPIVAVVLVEPAAEHTPSRLQWAWSRGSKLVAGGSMRLAPIGVRESDVARLATEWLSWTLQVSEGPQRAVLIMPDVLSADAVEQEGAPLLALSPARVGELLVSRWPGCAVDAIVHEDPLGATLSRLVHVLEQTPRDTTRDGARSLTQVSQRPGRPHRRMHQWLAGAIAAAAAGLVGLGWNVRRGVPAIEDAAKQWSNSWQPVVAPVWPQATQPTLGDPLKALQAEVDKVASTATLPAKAQRAMPVPQELETLSLVLASPRVELTELRIDSTLNVRIVAVVASTSDAEQLLESLRRVAGSRVATWTMEVQSLQGDKRTATYDGKWAKEGT